MRLLGACGSSNCLYGLKADWTISVLLNRAPLVQGSCGCQNRWSDYAFGICPAIARFKSKSGCGLATVCPQL